MQMNVLRPFGRASRVTRGTGALRRPGAVGAVASRQRPLGTALITAIGVVGVLAVGAGPAQAIPADRVYELVSPGTEGPGFEPNVTGSGVLAGARASSTEDAVAYQTLSPGTSSRRGQIRTYAARRGPDGWVTTTVSPESVTDTSVSTDPPRFTAFDFTDDITKGLFTSQAPEGRPVVADEPTTAVNLYRQDLTSGTNLLMTPFAPILSSGVTTPPAPRVGWASEDLDHVVYDVAASYFPTAPSSAVYAWSADQGASIASILPTGKFAGNASVGAGPNEAVDQASTFALKGYYGSNVGAISEDGSRIYFTDVRGSGGTASGRLYARRDHGTRNARTVELGLPEAGLPAVPSVATNGPKFVAASKDGRRVLLSSCGKLTADSTAIANASTGTCSTFGFSTSSPYGPNTTRRPELYLYDEDGNGGAGDLVDLTTTDPIDPPGAGFLGVVAAAEDLSRIYFAASGVLAPGGTVDKPDLYVWDETDGISFVAPLRARDAGLASSAVGDAPLWASVSSARKNAYVTPDGEHLAFSTYAKVDPNFDNRAVSGGDVLRQTYLYTYGEGQPVCVSCASAGRNGSEGTISNQRLSVPEMSYPGIADWAKRSITDDGRELYFESADKLVPTDTDVNVDVYVYRPETGRRELITTGRGGDASFAGATGDGLNVFFRQSRATLSPADENAAADLYTARLRRGDQVPDKPRPIDPCQGSACPDTPPSTILGPSTNLGAVPGFDVAEINGPRRSVWRRTGRLTLPVTTPSAGTITVSVRGTIRTTVKAKKKKKGAKAKPQYKIVRATVAQATQVVTGPGEHGVQLTLTKAARAQLKRTRKLSVTVDVRFGAARDTTDVRLVLPKVKAKKTAKKTTAKKTTVKKKTTAKKQTATKRAAR